MTLSRKVLNIRGYEVRVNTFRCVNRSLTEEVDDMAFEAVDDFLRQGATTPKLVDAQTALVEILRYYLQDICMPEVCYYYAVTGDDRNNPPENAGIKFTFDVEFQAKHSIIPTRISYTITY